MIYLVGIVAAANVVGLIYLAKVLKSVDQLKRKFGVK